LDIKRVLVFLQDVQAFIYQYNELFPKLFKWRDKTVIDSRTNGYVATKMGRRMVVTNSTKTTSIYNFPVQGSGSDGFKYALWSLDGELRNLDARVVHILHDEIIVEARAEIADKMEGVVKNCMEKAFEELEIGVVMLVEPEIKDVWG
jgi:DNA polymerase I